MSAGPGFSLGAKTARLATLLGLGPKPGMVITPPVLTLSSGRHSSCGVRVVHRGWKRGRRVLVGQQRMDKLLPVGEENPVCLPQPAPGSLWRKGGEDWPVRCARVLEAAAGICGRRGMRDPPSPAQPASSPLTRTACHHQGRSGTAGGLLSPAPTVQRGSTGTF